MFLKVIVKVFSPLCYRNEIFSIFHFLSSKLSQPSGRVQQAGREQLHMSECESFIKLYLCLQSQLSSVSPLPSPGAVTLSDRGETGRGRETRDCIPARLRPDLSGQTQTHRPTLNPGRKRGEYDAIFILFLTSFSEKINAV